MALVVFLRGINVGGYRRLRPSLLAKRLKHLDALNIGAAGTLVVRCPVTRAQLRAELARELPFDVVIIICDGHEVLRLLARDYFIGEPVRGDIVRFVSVLARRPRSEPALPLSLPAKGQWVLRLLAREDRFVVGVHRRQMKAIGHLGAIDSLFGVPATTRSWSTIAAIGKALRKW